MHVITTQQIKKIHTLLNELGMMDEKMNLVREWSTNRCSSVKQLTGKEAASLISWLYSRVKELPGRSTPRQDSNEKRKPMRNKIIHLLCNMGYVDPYGRPDYDAINKYVQNIGRRNPRKVILNYLWYDELQAVLNQVEERYRKEAQK